jgi:hypothetical protein
MLKNNPSAWHAINPNEIKLNSSFFFGLNPSACRVFLLNLEELAFADGSCAPSGFSV